MNKPIEATAGRILERGTVDYDDLEGDHYSTLKEMARSPKHYRWRLQHPRPQTHSTGLGHISHTAVLEPGRFLTDFVLMPDKWPGRDTKAVRSGKVWEAFRDENAGKTIISRDDYRTAIALSESVRADEVAMMYLGCGRAEVALQWHDIETGALLVGRVDWLNESIRDRPYLVDLKGTRCAETWSFQRDVAKYCYHIQAAMYVDGYKAATGVEPGYAIVAAEFEAPHDTVVYIAPDDVLDIGRDAYREWLQRKQECELAGKWPGIGNGLPKTLVLPRWAMPDDDADGDDLGLKGF